MAVADELRGRGAEVSFIGTRERIEAELVPAAGYELDFLAVGGIDRKRPLRAAAASLRALRAVGTARRLLRRRRPAVVMGGGGFVAGPVGLAALSLRIPLVLTEADTHLGLANRLLAGRARRVCLAFPIPGREGERYPLTGRPVPREVLTADRAASRARFGIDANARCLLVVGGSQGARSVNFSALDAFAADRGREFTVIHLAGRRDFPELRERLERLGPEDYVLLEYEPNLGQSLAASDLVLGRSGGSLFEFAAAGRPALLVPYPHATADHQTSNARWMERAGAAAVLADEEISTGRLRREVSAILEDDERLERMSAAALALGRPDAAARIADQVLAAG
jgi:UDP-N-acetylglucosamine--N-acetylmuramyl-(pentapeptide) pyrophosphoryl-undecaprenol N-acetylglucosamine transferase